MDYKNPYEFESLFNLMRLNFGSIVEKVKGMKVLILDKETSQIISLVYTHSYLLENEVLLTLNIDDRTVFNADPGAAVDSNLKYLKCVYVVAPTVENVNRISAEVKAPHFKEYYVYFTNKVNDDLLELMAKSDALDLVKGVYEYFVDFCVLDPALFTLNIANAKSLYEEGANIMLDATLSRIVNALFSVCCMLNQIPTVVYRRGNPVSQTIANKLQSYINNNNLNLQAIVQAYNNYNASRPPNADQVGCVLLVLDRRDDCITPLMNQWTYRAMIHELIGMANNKVSVDQTEYIFGHSDEFFHKHLYDEFVDVEADLNQLINQNRATTVDIYKMIETLPAQSKAMNDTTRHVKVLHELSKVIQKKKLLDSGLLEQDIATGRRSTINDLVELLNDPAAPVSEKLRLALLYCVRHAREPHKVAKVKDYLKMNRLEQLAQVVDEAVRLCRAAPAGKNQDFTLATLRDKLSKVSLESQSPYLQHKSQLYSTLCSLVKGRRRSAAGKLDAELYTAVPSAYDLCYTLRHKPASVVVFVHGGATFSEARDCSLISRATGVPIILGGSFIHNSRSFISDFLNYEALGL